MTYDLKSYGRGVAYIFVNESYGESGDFEDRTGAHREYKYLKRMFRDLTFKIRHYKDASNEKMIEELRKACSDPKMKERSCLVCVICSHGIEKTYEAVHALDGASNDITQHYIVDGRGNEINTDNIMSIVRDCKALKNKPKLFLMQVCRENMKAKEREKYDFGVTVNAKQEMSAYNSMSTDGSSKVGVTSKGQEDYVSGSDSDTDTDDGLSDQEEFDRTDYFRKRRQKIKQQQQRQKEDEEMRQEISKKDNNDKSEKTERPITETDSKAKRPSQRKIDTTVKTLGVREEKPVTVMSIPCYDDMLVMFASNPD
ncbi:uncharacterized protein LOC117325054 isoform X2 [Pecten maximus]|uniref:uncharacterized protein LOC117325054 isoform X2 n=1 Tax=Pecten maximus TaxID=6579 RepID=UPI001458035B|nr:uncharacterized protein LOC117325054 isoform X2 [Pecten maximus]